MDGWKNHFCLDVDYYKTHFPGLSCSMCSFFCTGLNNPYFLHTKQMLVYVTSLYAVREEYLSVLHLNFRQLIPHLHAPTYVFTDCPLPYPVPVHIHVQTCPLETFETYRRCVGESGSLPKNRTETKDTACFMALMNTKIEMLVKAMPHFPPQVTHAAWIDAGIWKIVKDDVRGAKAMATHVRARWPLNKVCLPGCWASPAPPSSDAICWRFCGGFLVVPTSLLLAFYKAVTSMLETWLCAGHLAWEVNIWAALECEEPAWFSWWGADHKESMLESPAYVATIG